MVQLFYGMSCVSLILKIPNQYPQDLHYFKIHVNGIFGGKNYFQNNHTRHSKLKKESKTPPPPNPNVPNLNASFRIELSMSLFTPSSSLEE